MSDRQKMLRWATPEEAIKGPREWCASGSDGSEYRIEGPVLGSGDRATRTVAEYYAVSRNRTRARGSIGVASERIGEAPTLKEAKALAQRHAEQG
jgi:hypothetical protein